MTLGELIEKLGGTLAQGNLEWNIDGVNSTESASLFDLVFADTPAATSAALAGNAGAVVIRSGTGALCSPTLGSDETAAKDEAPIASRQVKSVVETDQPRLWFARAAKLLAKPPASSGIHHSAVVAPDAVLAAGVTIGACAVVESGVHIGEGTRIEAGACIGHDVRIGEHCRIYPRAVVYSGATLGNRVLVHAGAVLGADGFGYVRDSVTGAYTQFPQQGTLVIEDDVEIGANSTIDRGALRETRIRRGTKIDNLVHVGHNCDIGEDVILVALTGISGSSSVGNGAVIAGQVGIGDHVHIGPGVILGGQAGVFSGSKLTNDGHKPGTVFFGTPARPLKQVLREQATLARLAKRARKTPE